MNARIAVWGLGSIGMRHAQNLLELGAEVVGFDPNPERRVMLEELGGLVCDDQKQTLERCSAAVIATPSETHLADLNAILSAGLHVFVEKPIAHAVEPLGEILDRADRQGLTVFAGLNMRFHPVVQAARKVLDEQTLGTAIWGRLLAASYLPDWRPHQDYRDNYAADPKTGGAIFDFIHEFDLAHFLLGRADVVAGEARCSGMLDMPSEDIADVLLRHESGTSSSIHVDYITRPRQRIIEICCEQGVMKLDLENACFGVWDVSGEQTVDQSFVYRPNDMYAAEMKAFLDTVQTGVPAVCSGREALMVLQAVVTARRLCGLPEV